MHLSGDELYRYYRFRIYFIFDALYIRIDYRIFATNVEGVSYSPKVLLGPAALAVMDKFSIKVLNCLHLQHVN
jgi:hypothetical protein